MSWPISFSTTYKVWPITYRTTYKVYAGTVNGLNIGAFMEKGLRMGAGDIAML